MSDGHGEPLPSCSATKVGESIVDVALAQYLPDLVMAKVLPTRPLVLATISRPLSVTKGLVPATRGLVMTAR